MRRDSCPLWYWRWPPAVTTTKLHQPDVRPARSRSMRPEAEARGPELPPALSSFRRRLSGQQIARLAVKDVAQGLEHAGLAADGMAVHDAVVIQTLDLAKLPAEAELKKKVVEVADNVKSLIAAPLGEA